MDWLKSLPLSLVAGITGCALVLAGLAQNLDIWSVSISIAGDYYRATAVAVGIVFVLAAIAHEVRSKPRQIPQGGPKNNQPVVYSLDDPGIPPLSERLTGAKRVTFLMRSGVSLFNQYAELFAKLSKNGCEFRVILTDPESSVGSTIYGADDDSFKTYANSTIENIARQAAADGGDNIDVRLIKYAPTFGAIVVEHKASQDDYIQVSLLFTHTLYGRDRPNFIVRRGDRWFKKYLAEVEASWEVAMPTIQPAELLEDQVSG